MTGGPSRNAERRIWRAGSRSGRGVRRPRRCAGRVLKPTKATANLPHLSVQDDGSIFASGDQSKRDLYTLRFSHRTEADHRDPARGPPRRSAAPRRAGPSLLRGAVRRLLPERVECHGRRQGGATEASDRERPEPRGQSRPRSTATRRPAGRSAAARGARIRPSFNSPHPLNDAGDLVIQLLFERYYAAGLGRFRISVTTDPQPSRGARHSRRDRGAAADPGGAADARAERRSSADTT